MEPLRDRCSVCGQRLSVEFVVDEQSRLHGHPDHGFQYGLEWIGKAWFVLDREKADLLFARLRELCARPLDGTCQCSAHEALRTAFRDLPYYAHEPVPITLRVGPGDRPRISLAILRPVDPDRLRTALALALEAHHHQFRKETGIPYISHPIGVASLVMEDGGSDDEVAAAFLHDAVEDAGEEFVARIRDALGDRVVGIVLECSDSVVPAGARKPPWKERKGAYLAQIPRKSPEAIRVSTADKLHNARAIVADGRELGAEVFDRFTPERDETLWYYDEVSRRSPSTPRPGLDSPTSSAAPSRRCTGSEKSRRLATREREVHVVLQRHPVATPLPPDPRERPHHDVARVDHARLVSDRSTYGLTARRSTEPSEETYGFSSGLMSIAHP